QSGGLIRAEVPGPPIDQKFGVRASDTEILLARILLQLLFPAKSTPQDRVDQRSIPRAGELHGFVNGRVLRGLEEKKLIKAKAQEVPRVLIQASRSERSNPKVEQA